MDQPVDNAASYTKLMELVALAKEVGANNSGCELRSRLETRIVGSQWFDNNQLKQAIGEEKYAEYETLRLSANFPDPGPMRVYVPSGEVGPYSQQTNYIAAVSIVAKYVDEVTAYQRATTARIVLLEKVIAERLERMKPKWNDSGLLVAGIELESHEIHNPSLVCQDHVYHLYSDGELTNQKGRELYLDRTEFTQEMGLILPRLRFPLHAANGLSYAIVTVKDGLELRQKMVDLANIYI